MRSDPKRDAVSSRGVLSQVSYLLAGKPTISLLFLLLAVIEALGLTVLFLSHTGIFNKVLGPIIARLWGSRYLHYPDNFLLLPKLYGYEHILAVSTFGLIITAIVIKKIHSFLCGDQSATTFSVASFAFKKYLPLLAIWIPLYVLIRFTTRALFPYLPANLFIQMGGLTLLLAFFQILTAFIFPAILLSGKGFLKSVGEGVALALRRAPELALFLIVPIFLSVLLSYSKTMLPFWFKAQPDFVLVFLYAGIFITYAVDAFITVVSTILYIKARNVKS